MCEVEGWRLRVEGCKLRQSWENQSGGDESGDESGFWGAHSRSLREIMSVISTVPSFEILRSSFPSPLTASRRRQITTAPLLEVHVTTPHPTAEGAGYYTP